MSTNSEYVSAMQAQMRQFDKDVDALGAEVGAKARAAYEEQLRGLRATRDAASQQLVQIQAASESAGVAMHAGMQTTWETMRAALKKVSSDMGK